MKRTLVFLVLAAAGLLFIRSGSTEPGPWDSHPSPQAPAQAGLRTAPVPSMPPGLKAEADFGKLPLYFIPNRGQTDKDVAFTVQGKDKTLYFTPGGITLAMTKPSPAAEPNAPPLASGPADEARVGRTPSATGGLMAINPPAGTDAERWVVKLDFVGANRDIRPVGEAETGASVSYFKGKPEDWRTGIPAYSRIVYRNLWPGIDLAYHGTVNTLKYEFIVHPGADPSAIRLAYRGAENVAVDPYGRLKVTTPAGEFTDDSPVAYQEREGRRIDIGLSYALSEDAISRTAEQADDAGRTRSEKDAAGEGSGAAVGAPSAPEAFAYGFTVGDYDPTRPLILDPAILVYCGYIGGTSYDTGEWIAVDGSGNAYVTGSTNSTQASFPVTAGPDVAHNGSSDIYVAKINAAGTALVYCGYIGGSSAESGLGIAVDGAGNAYVTGYTESNQTTFPVIVGPDLTHNTGDDAFVAKVNAAGTGLDYCGYIGGWMEETGYGIAVDDAGSAYVTGYTQSEDDDFAFPFPVKVGPDLTFNGAFGDSDGFVAKVNASGSGLDYCGYIGGSKTEAGTDIAVDAAGNAYVTGYTNSTESTFPVKIGPRLSYDNSDTNGFVAKISATGQQSDYCGYIGPGGGSGIDVDPAGNAYVTGATWATQATFPVTVGPDLTHNGAREAYVAKVNASGTGFIYCGYIGGSSDDYGLAVAVDAAGNAYVGGETRSTEATFPAKIGPDLTFNGGAADAFIAKVNPGGTGLVYCGYLGGSGEDKSRGIAVDGSGNAFLIGHTGSSPATFPVTVGPELTYDAGIYDAFVAKISYYEQPESKHAAGDFDGDGWDEVVMDFGATGAWVWDNSSWTQVATGNPENLATANLDGNADDELLLDLGASGLWLWDGGALAQISAVNVDCLAAGDTDADGSDEVAADFGAAGLWLRDSGSWTQLSGANLEFLAVADLDGTGGAEIIGDFGALGLWTRSGGSWTQLSGVNADRLAAGDTDGAGGEDLIGDFASTGLWLYGSGAWTMLSGVNADATIAADIDHSGEKEIVGDFASTGLWLWDSGSWTQLSGVNADDMLAADVDGDGAEEVLGDFATLGLWLFDAGGWSQVSGVNPEGLLAADVDGDGAREVVSDFGSLGVWKWDAGAWGQISANNPD